MKKGMYAVAAILGIALLVHAGTQTWDFEQDNLPVGDQDGHPAIIPPTPLDRGIAHCPGDSGCRALPRRSPSKRALGARPAWH